MTSTEETDLLEINPVVNEEQNPLLTIETNNQRNGAEAIFQEDDFLVKLTHFIHNQRQPSWFERGHNPISLLSSAISVIPLIDPIHQIAKQKSYSLEKEWLFITGTCGANFLLNFVFLKDFLQKAYLLAHPDLKDLTASLKAQAWSRGKIAFVSVLSTAAASVMAALPLNSNLADHPPAQYIAAAGTLISYIGLKSYSLAPLYDYIADFNSSDEQKAAKEAAQLKIAHFKEARSAVERLIKKGKFDEVKLDFSTLDKIVPTLNNIFDQKKKIQPEVKAAQKYQIPLGKGFDFSEKLLWLGITVVLISYTYGAYSGLLALSGNSDIAWLFAILAISVFGTLIFKASSEILQGSIQIAATVSKKLKEKEENIGNPFNPISWPRYLFEGLKIGIEESSTYSMSRFYKTSLLLRIVFTGLCALSFPTTTSLQESAADDPEVPFGFMKANPILWDFIYGLTIFVPDWFNYFCVSGSVNWITTCLLSWEGQEQFIKNQKILDTLDKVIANLEIATPKDVNNALSKIMQEDVNTDIESLASTSSPLGITEITEEETTQGTATNRASFFSGFKRYFCCDMDNSEENLQLLASS